MYRCEDCATVCGKSEPLRKYVIYRTVICIKPPKQQQKAPWQSFSRSETNGPRPEDLLGSSPPKRPTEGTRKEIDREIKVCQPCLVLLESGITLQSLMNQYHKNRVEAAEVQEVVVIVPPPPPPKVNKKLLLGKPG